MSGKKSRASRPVPADPFEPLDERAALLALAPPVARGPSPSVKATLLARIATEKRKRGEGTAPPSIAAGWRFSAMAAGEGWVKLPFPGVKLREITVDATRDTALLFIEMTPGSVFPDHEHMADERGLVLTGDLTMSGRRLGAGDFYEAAAGTRHERITSASGCTGLLWVGARAWKVWRGKLAAV